MSSKKPLKLAVLSLIGLLGLVACSSDDEIYAKPSNYEATLVSFDGNTDSIHNNIMSVVYDAMHSGNASTNALDTVLYLYAQSVFGSYNKITLGLDKDETTLRDAYEAYLAEDYDTLDAFIKSHKAYWEYNEKGEHIDANGNVIADGASWEPTETERKHVKSKWDAVEVRIAETMYKKISGGSYTTKNYFSEFDFLKALHQDSKKVKYSKDASFVAGLTKEIIPYTTEGKDVFNDGILHRVNYQDSNVADPDYAACRITYIEDEVVPAVYNDLLIEQYLLDEDIAAVRNSRARKINVLKIEKYTNFSNNADLLVQELVNEIYTGDVNKPSGSHVRIDTDKIEEVGEGLFEKYGVIAKGLYKQITDTSTVWTGIPATTIVGNMHTKASDVYKDVTPTMGSDYTYYNNTTYGDLVKEYEKIEKASAAANEYDALKDTKYSTFTSDGARSVLEGFEQQKIDIMQSANITKGWYIQSQSPSLDADGVINERLFTLSVANARQELAADADPEDIAELDKVDRYYLDGSDWKLRSAPAKDENKFLCSINGMYFLKFDGKYSGDDWKNDIVYDDGSAYYIVQVIEAAKDAKLRNTSATSYAKTRGQNKMDEFIDEIAKIVGSTGSYTSLSKTHWLEKMSIQFHDQKIYDYFKETYPDLFSDDDE